MEPMWHERIKKEKEMNENKTKQNNDKDPQK